jgi:hypothetical protein
MCRCGKWLFTEDVLACVECSDHPCGVQVIWKADVDRINRWIGEQGVVVGVGCRGSQRVSLSEVAGGYRLEVRTRARVDGRGKRTRGHEPRANKSPVKRWHLPADQRGPNKRTGGQCGLLGYLHDRNDIARLLSGNGHCRTALQVCTNARME